MQLCAES
ncbi:hypothetical protein AAFF_G00173900 [Aldrovandia affinis]|nr:hypothetical protein AAFF_G00173900 [Aldrovandia affinis]